MPEKFSISIDEVVDLLGLERDPKGSAGKTTYNVRCPFCDDPGKYHMNINAEKGTYHCVRCMDSCEKHTGTLDLYSRVRFGTRLRKGQNSKEIYIKLCDELRIGYREAKDMRRKVSKLPQKEEIEAAPDKLLDAAYHRLLHLPCFNLSEAHFNNLRKRGFDEKTIILNEYASIPPAKSILEKYPKAAAKAKAMIEASHGFDEAKKLAIFKDRHIQEDEIVAGAIVASSILRRGIKLDRIPGFFQMGDKHNIYVLLWQEGMAIPTRNAEKEIVGIQIRRDTTKKDTLRYATLSSKGFPLGVEKRIARTHFPLANANCGECKNIIITEGPLKADAAVELFQKLGLPQVRFIALQGVNSIAELPEIAERLQAEGITQVHSAFDMDRLCNVHVAKAGVTLRGKLEKYGIKVVPILWDMEYAIQKNAELKSLCNEKGINWNESENVFINIAEMSKALFAAKIEFNLKTVNGVTVKEPWNPKTKGIDDYLLSLLPTDAG